MVTQALVKTIDKKQHSEMHNATGKTLQRGMETMGLNN